MKRLFFISLLFCFSAISYAKPAENVYHFKTAEAQIRFEQLTQTLRCLVCQNQSLADSNAPLAQDLRAQIFAMINAQKTDADIKHYLIQRYGDFISYQPPFKPSTYILWSLPVVLLLAGIIIIRRLSR